MFLLLQVYECYVHIKDFQKAEMWYTKRVTAMKEQVSSSMGKAFTIDHDITNIQLVHIMSAHDHTHIPLRALGKFESGDLSQLKEVLEHHSDIRRDPDIQPLWDPTQLLNASRMLSLRSVVPWTDGSGSDDNVTADDGGGADFSSK